MKYWIWMKRERRKEYLKTCQMIDFNSHLFLFPFLNSPVFPTRTTYTPSSSNLHYFTNASPESQMWSTASGNNDEYDRPKNGALPDFQRLTNSYYAANGRANHINYATQVVSTIWIFYFAKMTVFWSNLLILFRMIHGPATMKRVPCHTMDLQQARQSLHQPLQ